MRAIVKGLKPKKGADVKKVLTKIAKEVQENLSSFLDDVKVTVQLRKRTLTVETTSDLMEGRNFLQFTGLFSGISGVSIEFPERNMEVHPV